MMQREADMKEHVGNGKPSAGDAPRFSPRTPRIGHEPEPAFADDLFIVDLSRAHAKCCGRRTPVIDG